MDIASRRESELRWFAQCRDKPVGGPQKLSLHKAKRGRKQVRRIAWRREESIGDSERLSVRDVRTADVRVRRTRRSEERHARASREPAGRPEKLSMPEVQRIARKHRIGVTYARTSEEPSGDPKWPASAHANGGAKVVQELGSN